MEFQIVTEPLNLLFSDMEVGEFFTTKGSKNVYQVIKMVGTDDEVTYGYVNLSTGLVKLVDASSAEFPVIEVEFIEPVKVRALI